MSWWPGRVARLRGERWPAGMVGSAPASRSEELHHGEAAVEGGVGDGSTWNIADGVDGGLDGGLLEEEDHDVGVVVAGSPDEWRPSIPVQGRWVGARPHQRLHDRQQASRACRVERRRVERRRSPACPRLQVVLAPVLDQPGGDGGLAVVDGEQQLRHFPVLLQALLQHRRVRRHAPLHLLQVAAVDVAEDGVLLPLGHGAGVADCCGQTDDGLDEGVVLLLMTATGPTAEAPLAIGLCMGGW